MTAGRRLVVRVEAFTGDERRIHEEALAVPDDGVQAALQRFAAHCARIVQKPGNPFHGMDPAQHCLVLELPFGAFRVVDLDGNVEPFDIIAGV